MSYSTIPDVFTEFYDGNPDMVNQLLTLVDSPVQGVSDDLFELRDILALQGRFERERYPLSDWPRIYKWRDCQNVWPPRIERDSREYMRQTLPIGFHDESVLVIDYANLIRYIGGAISYEAGAALDVYVQKAVMFFMADYLSRGPLREDITRDESGAIQHATMPYKKMREAVVNWSLYLYIKTREIRREIMAIKTSVRSLSVPLQMGTLKALLVEIKNRSAGVERRDIQQFLIRYGENLSDSEASSLITSLVTVNWLIKNGRVYGLTPFGESTIGIL